MGYSLYGARTFFQYLKTSTGGITAAFTTGGTGTGASTGSTHGGTITAGPATGKKWHVKRMDVILGGGVADIYSTKFGDSAALTNGAKVHIQSSTGSLYYLFGTTDLPIKTNAGWADVGFPDIVDWKTFQGMQVHIDFPEVYGEGFILDGDKQEKIAVWFTESTTGVLHKYLIKGVEISK